MARAVLTKTTVKGPFPTLPVGANGLKITLAAADVANKNQFLPTGNDLIVAQNSGASPYTISITSAVDGSNRTGDITTYSLAATDVVCFLVKGGAGWVQADGYVYLEASNASVLLGVVAL